MKSIQFAVAATDTKAFVFGAVTNQQYLQENHYLTGANPSISDLKLIHLPQVRLKCRNPESGALENLSYFTITRQSQAMA
jgi:hypothetical protein